MDHLLNVMRKPDERESGFVALAEMANAVGKELKQYLPDIMNILKDAVRILSYCYFLPIL
jgi:FKBP12-rapamycin complex-associated protein